uniref:Mitoferrin-1 n=1 Tax=Phallusia mammillata TaxID=59560 RepID=A0A6F9DSN1_9ASCI|nr:mitoferrin-1 [Phallusia mammillata]
MSFLSETTLTQNFVTTMDNDDYDALPVDWPMSTHMLAGAAAGIMEHATMYPVDCIKTQMQSIRSVYYSGLRDAFVTISQREGARRLLRGMSAMVIGAGPAHAMYFACYEKTKHTLTLKINGRKWKNSSIANGLAGAVSTFFHDVVMNPADVIKQRMQMYGSTHTTCRSCLVHTYQTEGIRAFYRSFPTQFLMNVPFQTVHFVVYELTQEYVNPTRTYLPLSHIFSGATAGGAAAFVTNPLDVCRTLLNTQESQQDTKVRGLRQAIVMVYRTDGLRTFFRGVTARMFYQMPSTAISWSVYEAFKHLLYNKTSKSKNEPAEKNYTTYTPPAWTPACSGSILPPPNK